MKNLLANIRVSFTYTDEDMVREIITSFMRPTLEYATVVCNPHLNKNTLKKKRYKEQPRDGFQV